MSVFGNIYDAFSSYDSHKLKSNLEMASTRISIKTEKKSVLAKKKKLDIANLIRNVDNERAEIMCEQVIRDDFTIEAATTLKLLLDVTVERLPYFNSCTQCPQDMKQAICTLIWSSSRVDIAEMKEVARQLKLKLGKPFYDAAIQNSGFELINERVAEKLSPKPPSQQLVEDYMVAIAQEYNVEYKPKNLDGDLSQPRTTVGAGYSIPMAPVSNITQPYMNPVATPVAPVNGTLRNVQVIATTAQVPQPPVVGAPINVTSPPVSVPAPYLPPQVAKTLPAGGATKSVPTSAPAPAPTPTQAPVPPPATVPTPASADVGTGNETSENVGSENNSDGTNGTASEDDPAAALRARFEALRKG